MYINCSTEAGKEKMFALMKAACSASEIVRSLLGSTLCGAHPVMIP